MANFSVVNKQKYCEELDNFIKNTENCLKETYSYLNWDFNNKSENDELFITCPFDKSHRIPQTTIGKHLEKCEWNILGYTKNCIPLSESTLLPNNPSTIKFDMQLQHKILQTAKQKNPELNIGIDEKLIPQTSDRLLSDFTNDERKAMYEYVISNTIAPDIGQDITDINKPEKTNKQNTPIIELLAQERNLKRRRTKHRGVHTNKKSHIEILRELVQQQMEMFKEHISEKFGIPIFKNIQNNSLFPKSNENETRKTNKNEFIIDQVSGNTISKTSEKKIFENNIFHYHKHEYDTKNFNNRLKNKIKDNKDYTDYKYSSHYNNYDYKSLSKNQNSQNSLQKHNYYEKDQGKYESSDKDNYQCETRRRIHNKSDNGDKNRDHKSSRYHKKDRSKSKEKKYIEKFNYQEQRHHKKHKEIHKNKKEHYFYDKEKRNYDNYIHKRDK